MKSKDDILKSISSYDLENDINKKFTKLWKRLSSDKALSSQKYPVGILLGGQPGAGKSFATMEIKNRLNNNVLVINGDEFRSYHKHYDDFYQLYGKDASKYTGAFAGKMVEKIRDEAIKNHFNIVIEGTFRTTETPLKELNNFREKGYKVEVVVCTCPKELSWESTIKRAEELKDAGLQPRYVPQEHHDLVVKNLAKNVQTIFESGLVSHLEIFSRSQKLFDSRVNDQKEIESVINNELQGLNKLKKEYQIEFSYNKEDKTRYSYNVLVNNVQASEAIKQNPEIEKVLDHVASHKDLVAKGVTAEQLKSGVIYPQKLDNEIKVTRPENRTVDNQGNKIELTKAKTSQLEL